MSDIENVKSRLDIVDVVAKYVPGLKRAGRSYKSNCPFHQEKTASFIVTPELQIFKCFGCGEGGDVISFIQKIERVDFGRALEIAAERAGVELTQGASKQDAARKQRQKRILEANALAAKYWHYILMTHKAGKPGREYMQKRGIRPEEAEKFMLGYAPPGQQNLKKFMLQKGFSEADLVLWGLLVERGSQKLDKFRDRLVLSIYDTQGEIVGFSGRQITPSDFAPKYLNSPETEVYHKGDILMGIYQAKEATRKANFVILEEGNIDLLSSHKVGVENIAATGGTALTEKQCKLIKRFADQVYFCFDTDTAGHKALLNGIEIAERIGLMHKVLDIGDYQDPDELISKEPQRWAKVVAAPKNSLEFLLHKYQQDLDLGSADGKRTLLDRMLRVLGLVKDAVQLNHFAEQTALLCGITQQQVLDKVRNPVPQSYAEQPTPNLPEPVLGKIPMVNKREIYLLALIVETDQAAKVDKQIFSDINAQELFAKLTNKPTGKPNFGRLAEELSDGAKELLQEVLMTDLSGLEDLPLEMQKVSLLLQIEQLKTQMLELRQGLQHSPDDAQILSNLQKLTTQLRQLQA